MNLTGKDYINSMKAKLSLCLGLFVSTSLPLLNIACSEESALETISVSSISLNKTSITLTIGDTISLIATILPDNATDKTITWSSSNANVATVDNGKVKGITVGIATITAVSGNVKAECSVTVNPVEVTSIALNNDKLSLIIGNSYQLTATVFPNNATNKTIVWSSSNNSIATVDNGKVTGKALGTATITAQSGNVKAECSVTINPVEVTSITLNKTTLSLTAGETFDLIATVLPNNATDKTVTWYSSNNSIVTVDNGKVKALAKGTATVTAKAGNMQANCSVTVNYIEATSVLLNKSSITLSVGETVELTATVYPNNATNKTIVWTSSNTHVATVDNGQISAIAVGTATITAQNSDGPSSTCSIAVVNKPSSGGSEGTGDIEW